MGWREEQEEQRERVRTELSGLLETETTETLQKRFLVDFGCINFMPENKSHELKLAREYHSLLKELDPDSHKVTETEPYRCYHKTSCSCGFAEACDSSD